MSRLERRVNPDEPQIPGRKPRSQRGASRVSLAALVTAGSLGLGGIGVGFGLGRGSAQSGERAATPTSLIQTSPSSEVTVPPVTPPTSEAPKVDPLKKVAEGVSVNGLPESVDSKTVDTAKGVFKNTIGLGTEQTFAEPGGLLVGPDFGSKSDANPHGGNAKGWDAMYDSGGAIQPFSPVSQDVLHTLEPYFQNLPEGGWNIYSGGDMTLTVPGKDNVPAVIQVEGGAGITNLVYIRGKYGDQQQDTDANNTVELTGYKAGHVLAEMLVSGDKSNIGFLSEGQFKQKVETAHSGGTNSGDGGSSLVRVTLFDVNTGALTVLEQDAERFADTSKGWKRTYSNWKK